MVGLVLGMFGSFLLGYIIDDAMTEITLTVIVCFSSFMISESTKVRAGFAFVGAQPQPQPPHPPLGDLSIDRYTAHPRRCIWHG